MTQPAPVAALSLGFLTVVQDAGGYLGGYLVTNNWGRPLEFRLSTVVQPNRVQQILYGGTLQSYLTAEVIGKTLVDKTSTPVQLILTDQESVLNLRLRLEVPVAWLASTEGLPDLSALVRPAVDGLGPVLRHPHFSGDAPRIQQVLEKLEATIDLAEPFSRIREAIAEARKMGVTKAAS